MKRVLTAVCLAAGLLVSPVGMRHDGLGLIDALDVGAQPLAAVECKLEVELCQEFDFVFYKTKACWKVKLFCDWSAVPLQPGRRLGRGDDPCWGSGGVTRGVALAVIVGLMAACRTGPDAEAARFTIVREFQPPPGGSFWAPIDLAATAEHVWVLDVGAAQVYGYAPDGTYRVTLGMPGAGPGELKEPLALGVAGDSLWVLNAGNRRIEYYAASADSLGSALGSEPLPDSLPPPIDMVRLGGDWYATTPFLPEPVVRFHSGGGAWTTFGSEVVEAAAKLKPRAASIPDAYRIEVEDSRVWVLHLYLPVLGVYDRSGKLDRVVTYPGEQIEARAPVEQDGGEGRVRRLIRAPRSPAGGLGLLRVGSGNYVLTHQRSEGRQMLYRIARDVGAERDGRIQKQVRSERKGGVEVEVANRATVLPPRTLFLTSIRSHGRTYAVGTRGEYEDPSVFVLE